MSASVKSHRASWLDAATCMPVINNSAADWKRKSCICDQRAPPCIWCFRHHADAIVISATTRKLLDLACRDAIDWWSGDISRLMAWKSFTTGVLSWRAAGCKLIKFRDAENRTAARRNADHLFDSWAMAIIFDRLFDTRQYRRRYAGRRWCLKMWQSDILWLSWLKSSPCFSALCFLACSSH